MTNMLPKNFDWQFYLENNSDLKDAGLSTQTDAENHWLNHGYVENRIYKPKRKINTKVVNCYHKDSSSGIGDILRGSIFLFEHFDDVSINFSNHPISKYLHSNSNDIIESESIVDIYQEAVRRYGLSYTLAQLEQTLYGAIEETPFISSMYSYLLNSDGKPIHSQFQEHKIDCYTRNLLQQELHFHQDVEDYYGNLKLKDFDVSHVRLGDYKIMQDKLDIKDDAILNQTNYKNYQINIDYIIHSIFSIQAKRNKKMIVMSDNNDFKRALINKAKLLDIQDNFDIIHTQSNHCSSRPGLLSHTDHFNKIEDIELFNVALDMKILSQASSIDSYSVYPWGSGFSYAIAKIYDIPLSINIL